MIDQIGVVSHHLRTLLGAILVNWFACLCMWSIIFWCLDQGDSIVQVRGLTYLPSLKKLQLIIYKEYNYETTCIPHHFLFSISEKYCTKFQATHSSHITSISRVMVFPPYITDGRATANADAGWVELLSRSGLANPVHGVACRQCSRLKPSYEFHFEGVSNFNASVEGLVQMQDVNPIT